MKIIELLAKAAGVPADKLRQIITAGAKAVPDLGPEAATLLAKLDDALGVEALERLGVAIIQEAKDIASGKIVPKDHPSDLA